MDFVLCALPLVSLQPRRTQPSCFGWRVRYLLNSIIVKIGAAELDGQIQCLAKPTDANRNAVALLVSIERVEPVSPGTGCSTNRQQDVAFLQSAVLGGRVRTKRTQAESLPVRAIDDDARRVRLACDSSDQTQANGGQRIVVRQRLDTMNMLRKPAGHIHSGGFRDYTCEIFNGVAAALQVIRRIRALDIKFIVSSPHDIIQRPLALRSAANEQVQVEGDQFALQVVTKRAVLQVRAVAIGSSVDERRGHRRSLRA